MVLFWVVLLVQAAIVGSLYLVAEQSRMVADSSPSEPGTGQVERKTPLPQPGVAQDPHWIEEPHETASGVQAKAAAGDRPAVILVDGAAKAYIPADEHVSINVPNSLGPRSWSLQPADLHREAERWTWGNSDYRGLTQVPAANGIAITFDGGWRADRAEEILATLRDHDKRATFFLTGQFLKNYPDLTRRIVAAGHEVANHTWSHLHLTTFADDRRHRTRSDVDRQRLQWELLRTEQLFYRITGQGMAPLWRAPYGEINEEIEQWGRELGYTHIGWTVNGNRDRSLDTLDWVSDPDHELFVSGEKMAERITRLAKSSDFSGGIVLMHLGGAERPDPVHQHLGRMIRQLRESDIPTVTVSELIQAGR